MHETSLLAFQLAEIMPAIEAFLLCFGVGLVLLAIKIAYQKCAK